MNIARVLTAASACVAVTAAAAACSGSFGSGSGLPNTLASMGPGGVGSPTPTPNSSSTILTYGESESFQDLAEVGGYSASVALPKAPPPKAEQSAKAKGDAAAPAPTPVSIAIGATLSVVKPEDGPDLNFESGKGKRRQTRRHPARALAYISLLPTHDITLESYPRIAVDIPRQTAAQYRDGEFGLALWNSGEKDAKYRLAVAELESLSTPAPTRGTPPASPGARSSRAPASIAPAPAPSGTGATPLPSPSATLPPARIVFAGTATPFKLVANRPAIFAVYALPRPAASPVPSSTP